MSQRGVRERDGVRLATARLVKIARPQKRLYRTATESSGGRAWLRAWERLGMLRAMRLWLSRSSEVPLREQLVTQIRLGIISGDLAPRQKLPSTRELARRFHIHANTVSAAYRELHRRGWVEFRKGSGVYVRGDAVEPTKDQDVGLDRMIASFFQSARAKGFTPRAIESHLHQWLRLQPPDHFLLIEPDPELRLILSTEIRQATEAPVAETSIQDFNPARVLSRAIPLAMYGQRERVSAALPPQDGLVVLRSRSVPEVLQTQTRPAADALIAIVSRWPEFLSWSRAILVAAGLDPKTLSLHDARERRWQKGLRSMTLVVTDSAVAHEMPAGCETRVFRLLSDSSINELINLSRQFEQR